MVVSFIFLLSHDDVIGKITLAKDAIGSQAKGKAPRLNTHHLPTNLPKLGVIYEKSLGNVFRSRIHTFNQIYFCYQVKMQ